MVKRKMGFLTRIFLLCICLIPCTVLNVSAIDAKDPIITDRKCSLTISYQCEDVVFPDQTVNLYKVAEVSRDFRYTLEPSFLSAGVVINKVESNDDWNAIRATLESYILANEIEPILTAVTDGRGEVHFSGLKPGMYLAAPVSVTEDDGIFVFDAALIAVPGLAGNGHWQYQVAVAAKVEILPPVHPEEEIYLKVLKLWKGDGGSNQRPESVEVEIFRDGVHYQTVYLSEDTQWSYSWSIHEDGASWMVAERNVPSGYTAVLEKRGATFVLTNKWGEEEIPSNENSLEESSKESVISAMKTKTGDTSNILLYIVLMYLAGGALILLGIREKSKQK